MLSRSVAPPNAKYLRNAFTSLTLVFGFPILKFSLSAFSIAYLASKLGNLV
jgi:hypothetical protein